MRRDFKHRALRGGCHPLGKIARGPVGGLGVCALAVLEGGRSRPLAGLGASGRSEETVAFDPGSTLLLYTDRQDDAAGRAVEIACEELGFDEVEARMLLDGSLQLLSRRDRRVVSLQLLSRRDRRVVSLRFGEGLTHSQIAERVGVSQMHVSRILRAAIETLRGQLDGDASNRR